MSLSPLSVLSRPLLVAFNDSCVSRVGVLLFLGEQLLLAGEDLCKLSLNPRGAALLLKQGKMPVEDVAGAADTHRRPPPGGTALCHFTLEVSLSHAASTLL